MNEDLNTLISEIEESTNKNESISSTEDTSPTSDKDDLDVEEILSSSEAPKKSASEIAEQKKEAWARNIASGKKTLEDLANTPSDRWALSEVKKRLGVSDEGNLEEKIKAYDQSKQYNQDKETFKTLPIEVKKELKPLIEKYLKMKVSPEIALREVLNESQHIVEDKESTRKNRVEAGQLPTGKSSSGKNVYTADQVSKMSQAEYNKFRAMEKKGEVELKL